jgi:glycyl-radical enzyme activating protein
MDTGSIKIVEKGFVFDIQRASFHDGPGIRTTVFLKGCSLNCLWCHNPEAVAYQPQLFCNFDKCVLCGSCVLVCDQGVHHIQNGQHLIDYDRCNLCGKCVEVCQNKALKIMGAEMTVAEVMEDVLADREFYASSGGGITLSGGEPMFQFAFALSLLKHSRDAGINTCLETSGYAPGQRYQEILPFVDTVLFDYKVTGSSDYKKYTGVENELILKNLDLIYHAGVPLILRCPVIPGVNDTPQHFKGIQSLNATYPDLVGIEILPYHDMGNSKRTSIGLNKTLVELKTTSQQSAAGWLNELRGLGCAKIKIG